MQLVWIIIIYFYSYFIFIFIYIYLFIHSFIERYRNSIRYTELLNILIINYIKKCIETKIGDLKSYI